MRSDEGGKVLIYEWREYRFYINRIDHGTAHFHVWEHNREICEYSIQTLKHRKGRTNEQLHNHIQAWGYRNKEEILVRWREITGIPPHGENPSPPMPAKQKQLRRRKRKK